MWQLEAIVNIKYTQVRNAVSLWTMLMKDKGLIQLTDQKLFTKHMILRPSFQQSQISQIFLDSHIILNNQLILTPASYV